MIHKLLAWLAGIGAVVVMFIAARKDAKADGRQEQQLDEAEGRLDDIHQANIIRDRLDSDPDYHDRVQERFTRD